MSGKQQTLGAADGRANSDSNQPSEENDSGCRGTPSWLIKKFHSALGGRFDTDPASGAEQTALAETRYTAADDGLSKQWDGAVWLNPPFDNWPAWASKAGRELATPRVDYIVFLMGSLSLSADWFHDNFVPHIDELAVLSDRLAFEPYDEKANQPLLLGTLGETPSAIEDVFQDIGAVYTPKSEMATLDAFTDGGAHPQEVLEDSPHWAEKPAGGYSSDTTWYLDRDRETLITNSHSEAVSRPA